MGENGNPVETHIVINSCRQDLSESIFSVLTEASARPHIRWMMCLLMVPTGSDFLFLLSTLEHSAAEFAPISLCTVKYRTC
jgi:hypothetical protein